MQGNFENQPSQNDFDVQVITLQHATSAALRGSIQLLLGVVLLWLSADFVTWAIWDFPDFIAIVSRSGSAVILLQAPLAVLGLVLTLEGQKKIFFVTLVYFLDRWLGGRRTAIARRERTNI